MRRYGSAKRNPNPVWPGVQAPILPPGSKSSAMQIREMEGSDNSVAAVQEETKTTVHERDGFVPIMGYMTESDKMTSPHKMGFAKPEPSDMNITDYLCDKSGCYARVEFLFGENTHIEKTGVLESVGKDYIVLAEAGTGSRIVCLAKNIKFINLYNIK